MIEQIINWYSNLSTDIRLLIFLVTLLGLCLFITIYFETIKNKRKTITQKYREGLIKK